jgi:hypothetical protein
MFQSSIEGIPRKRQDNSWNLQKRDLRPIRDSPKKGEQGNMADQEKYYSTIRVEEKHLTARFDNINDRDGFEISLGMYKANLGPLTEEVFRRFTDKFSGEVIVQPEA